MSDKQRVALQIFLGVVIVVLAYVLVRSIRDPYKERRQQELVTERLHQRMELTRTALTRYRDRRGRFPNTLDSLLMFVNEDQRARTELDSLYRRRDFSADSLLQSPNTGNPFEYETSPDSLLVDIYRLRDPDSDAQIGTLDQDITQVNVPNWD